MEKLYDIQIMYINKDGNFKYYELHKIQEDNVDSLIKKTILSMYLKDEIKEVVNISKFTINKKDIDTFIEEHNHICYCEALVFPDGEIAYVNPSHVETLIRATGKSRDIIYEIMPQNESPISWLIDYTGIVAVWYDGCIFPKDITKNQEETIKRLKEKKLLEV